MLPKLIRRICRFSLSTKPYCFEFCCNISYHKFRNWI